MSSASIPSLFVTPPNGRAYPQDLSQVPAAQLPPAAAAPLVQRAHKYYCTYCDSPKGFDVQDDWRMHEEDHVSTYICMLHGATEATPHGFKCVFCGALVPSEDYHALAHNAHTCGPGVYGRFSCNAKEGMIDHVNKAHHAVGWKLNIPLLNKWKAILNRQAWSCGFCVIALPDFKLRLNHIAWHFEQGQTMDKWDTSNVIQGLLQQPRLIKAWNETTESLLGVSTDCLYWEKHVIAALRHNLEAGPSMWTSARDLAKAALAASEVDCEKLAEMFVAADPSAIHSSYQQ